MANDLLQLLEKPEANRDAICEMLSKYIHQTIEYVNNVFSVRKLVKLANKYDPLPKDPRLLSSYRTRMGTIIEYAIGSHLDNILYTQFGDALTFTFSYIHEYPDFYVRNKEKEELLKIELKLVDCESDEQAARFDAPTIDIDENRDFVLFMGWEWIEGFDTPKGWARPNIFEYVLIPSIEIAKERDYRVQLLGGKIDGRTVFVPSTKEPGKMVEDPGNYGKFWRIVHPSRRDVTDLDEHIKRFLAFQKKVDEKAPRDRMKNYRVRTHKLSDFHSFNFF